MRHPHLIKITDAGLLSRFFDFYALNEIWFKTVGMADFGYAATKILPEKKDQAIRETFVKVVADLKADVIVCLEKSVRTEIRHWRYETDDYREDYHRVIKRFGMTHNTPTSRLMEFPLTTIEGLFMAKCWASDYGGKKWGIATHFLIKLMESKTLKDDVFFLDRIFDLQHNNGFILNKTQFRVLCGGRRFKGRKHCMKPLNFRFKASLRDLVEAGSSLSRRIYFANLNYLGV